MLEKLKKVFTFTSILISPLLLLILIVEIMNAVALDDYSMLPSKPIVVDKVVLGRRERGFRRGLGSAYYLEFGEGIFKAFRRGAIELICTSTGNIKLVMKDFKTYYESSDDATLHISFRIENGIAKGEVHINEIRFGSSGYFDSFASAPLTETEISSIIKALKQRKSNRVGLSTMDGGNGFRGDAKLSDVEKLIRRCKQNR